MVGSVVSTGFSTIFRLSSEIGWHGGRLRVAVSMTISSRLCTKHQPYSNITFIRHVFGENAFKLYFSVLVTHVQITRTGYGTNDTRCFFGATFAPLRIAE